MSKKLNLRELLNFYDYRVPESHSHASAINAVLGEDLGVALLVHYFKGLGLEVNALTEKCNQKTKSGYRLDKWITVKSPSASIIYQVEIKNWSAHSVGGRSVRTNANDDYMRDFRIRRWNFQFNSIKQLPSQKETLKVLTKMRVPDECFAYEHEALLCFWEPLHPLGEPEPFFEVDVRSEVFRKLKIFSMSNYVSQLLKTSETLEVEMPDADARINWLEKLFS